MLYNQTGGYFNTDTPQWGSLGNLASQSAFTWQPTTGGFQFGSSPVYTQDALAQMSPDVRIGIEQQYATPGVNAQGMQTFGNSFLGQTQVLPSGQTVQTPGWGNILMQGLGLLGNLWGANKQYKLGREQLDFAKQQWEDNFRMMMDAYRRKANRAAGQAAWKRLGYGGTMTDESDITDRYNRGDVYLDSSGRNLGKDGNNRRKKRSAFAGNVQAPAQGSGKVS